MNRFLNIVFSGFLFLLAGCVPSLHPLYTPEDLLFDPALVGEWLDKDGKEAWTFSRSGDKQYRATYLDDNGKTGEFIVHLLKVEDRSFLDLYPVEPDSKQNSFYLSHLRRVHTFMRIKHDGQTLQFAILEADWLDKLLKEKPEALRHEIADDSLILTARPKELQAFLALHEDNAEAWNEQPAMTRKATLPTGNTP
jgi:hypothetical protein